MLIYIIIFLTILILGIVFNPRKSKINRKIFLSTSFILLCVPAMFRATTVGIDTPQYSNAFRRIANMSTSNFYMLRYEKGFTYFCKILSLISSQPQTLIIISSLIINISVFRFIRKNSENDVISVLVYIVLNFYFAYMNIMRQALAVAIILFGYEFLKERKYIKFVAFVLLASLFHGSAVLALLYIPIREFKFDRKFIVTTFLISGICLLVGDKFFLLLTRYSSRLGGYIGSDYDVSNYFGALINAILYLVIFITGMIIIRKNDREALTNKNDNLNSVIGMIGLTCIISILIVRIAIFNRFVPYFSIFNVIWISNCLAKIEKSKTRFTLTILIMLVLISYWYVIMLLRPEWYGAVPYTTCF